MRWARSDLIAILACLGVISTGCGCGRHAEALPLVQTTIAQPARRKYQCLMLPLSGDSLMRPLQFKYTAQLGHAAYACAKSFDI